MEREYHVSEQVFVDSGKVGDGELGTGLSSKATANGNSHLRLQTYMGKGGNGESGSDGWAKDGFVRARLESSRP